MEIGKTDRHPSHKKKEKVRSRNAKEIPKEVKQRPVGRSGRRQAVVGKGEKDAYRHQETEERNSI